MNEIEIKRHSFDLAKNRLKEFSEKREAELQIDKVQTDGGFLGLGDHKVTGYELNRRLETIQEHFIAVNTTNNKVIKEFREIYNALDVLDRDYIASIVANVKAIEKTNNDVRIQQGTLRQHNDKLASQQSKLDAHQVEIEKNVANISKIVTALKVFKEKLEVYKHLTDIDKIWNDCKTIQNEIRVVSDSITKFSKKTTEDIAAANDRSKALSDLVFKEIVTLRDEAKSFKDYFSDLSEKVESTANLLDNQIPVIQEVVSFVEWIKNLSHIDDIDSMWNDISEAREKLNVINNSLQNIDADIQNMQKHIDEVDAFISNINGYEHLQDVDEMWESLANAHSTLKNIGGTIEVIQEGAAKHQEEINKILAFVEKVSSLEHLIDVDKLWSLVEEQQLRLKDIDRINDEQTRQLESLSRENNKIADRVSANENSIKNLNESINKINGMAHLKDVDSTWDTVKEQSGQLTEMEKQNETIATSVQKNKEDVEAKIVEANNAIASLTQKIKYAYLIAGGAAGLAIIELILLLV